MRRCSPAVLGWRRTRVLSLSALFVGSLVVGLSPSVHAQFGPGGGMSPMGGGAGGPGMGGGMGGGPPPDTKEGPAEQAPGVAIGDIASEPLPEWNEKKERNLQTFALNGYLRGRGFYWHNFNLGHFNDPAVRANPFGIPYSEIPDATGGAGNGSCFARSGDANCLERGIRTADMRLRLDPRLNVSDQITIFSQIDIFDNLVLGSTPEGFYLNGRGGAIDGYPAFRGGRTQLPQESMANELWSSIRAKRAWGEVKSSLMEVSFGRMPFMWGMGMLYNDGNCNDCDFGSTVDRFMLTFSRWDHFLSLTWDWASSGPTSQIVQNQQLYGFNYNIDNVDDVMQWALMFGRKDSPTEIADRLEKGKVVLNYGLLAMFRTQGWDLVNNPRPQVTPANMPGPDPTEYVSAKDLQKSLGRRDAWAVTVDLWGQLQWKRLQLEAEGVGIFGSVGELGVYGDGGYGTTTALNKATLRIAQLGGVLRGSYRFFKKDTPLIIGLEVGSASGPQNGDPRGELNFRRAREKPNGFLDRDGYLALENTRFAFDPDFHVDMILFRRILGTVYNATYMKPSVTYWLIESFGGQAEFIYSLANRPATFPGHAINMGAEINLRVMYRNLTEGQGFFATLEYGVLFDLGALSQNPMIWNDSLTRKVDASTAQAFQAKIQVRF